MKTQPSKATTKPKGRKNQQAAERRVFLKKLPELWAGAVKRVWGGKCAVCGKAGTSAHHYYGKKAFPRVMFEINNGVWLCFYHHIVRIHRCGDIEPVRAALINKIGQEGFDGLSKKATDTGKQLTLDYLVDVEKTLGSIAKLKTR